MKKLFHLGIVSLFIISVSSCSKSADDLAANQQSSSKSSKYRNPNGLLNGFAPGENAEWGESKFFPFINQPYDLMLGDGDNSILHTDGNEFAAFFVVVSYDYSELPAEQANLILWDDDSNQMINRYQLMTAETAADYGVKVPEDLNGQWVYFAIVPMADLSTGIKTTVSLYSDITTINGTITSQLPQAFMIMP
ncbi:MAG: hypothetical protein HZB42_12985 [Sphingobacteriales bacterium]|nr:hypothetical protein [Sphingobacteriales bacterium]